ncbi:hypothetical protein Tco_1410057 [Tanacetum coccineum]
MGIPLDNVGEILDVDLYEEVAQQGQAEDQPYAEDASPTAESHGYIADSNPMEDDTNADSIDYPDEPGTDDEDEDPKEDPSEEHKPENEDAKEDESFETRLCRARKTVRLDSPMPASIEARIAEHAIAPIPPTSPTYDQAPLSHRAAMIRMRDDIPEEDMPPQRRFILTAPLHGYDIAESSDVAAARASRGQYDFVDAVGTGQGFDS